MASVQEPLKQPPLTPHHMCLRPQWAQKYMTLSMSYVLFTDKSRLAFNGPDGCTNGWSYFGDELH